MLSTIASLIAIGYLTGAIVFRLPVADRHKRAALPAEERLFWAVVISVVVTSTLAFVLAAMSAYSLRALVACNVAVAAALALTSLGDLRLGAAAPRPRWTAAIPFVLVATGAWMYFGAPAAEYVLGGRDPGVYVNEGIQIAQRQSLVTIDRVAAAVPESTRDLFFPSHSNPNYYSVRFMGFHLRDPAAGSVTGQFPQGYPIWIAIAYGLDGVTGTRRVIAWWAILGVLAVYFAAKRLIGPLPAAAAAGLLCVHVIQTWYARYPNSEIVTQALLFAALLAHAYAHEDEDRFFGPVAASLLGLALFTRFPVVVAVGAAVAASLLAHVGGHRARAGFLVTMTAWVVAAGAYYLTQLRPYFDRPVAYVQLLAPIQLVAVALAGAAACALIWASRRPRASAAIRAFLPPTLIAIVTIGGIYALFLREAGGMLAPHDAHAVRMFADLYFTRLAFVFALIGYALVVWRSFWRAPALILVITTMAALFFYKMRIFPEHFWLARRFLTEILPGALIFASAAVFAPVWTTRPGDGSWRSARAVFTAVGVIATLLLGYRYLSASVPIRQHVEYAQVIPHLEKLASRFSDNDLVLVESRAASDVHVLALPLSYIYARNVLVLYDSRPDKRTVGEFLKWAYERYENVYFIAGGGTDLLSPGVGSIVLATERFQVPEFEKTTYDIYPRRSVRKPFDFTIYRLVQTGLTPPPHSLDIGGTDDLHLVDFFPKERLGGGNLTFRWSQDTSYLLMSVPPASREVALRLNGGRPRGVPLPRVTVSIEGEELGSVELTNEFRDYVFPIPAPTASSLAGRPDGVQIRIQSSTWTPRDILGGPDTRALGVMIDKAEIRVVFEHLQIPYRQERVLVGLADAGLAAAKRVGWPRTAHDTSAGAPRRVLLLRLERVGDLVMVLDAIAMVRAMAPDAAIDLVVGSWNKALAGLIPGVNVETVDVPWMTRQGRSLSWFELVRRAHAWRRKDYDLAINFEPDIRSNLLLALSRARRRVGFVSGGGGAVLTDAIAPDPRAHIADNARALVARAFETIAVAQGFLPAEASAKAGSPASSARLNIPDDARRRAAELVGTATEGRPLVGIQPAAGRRIKEWDPVRFAEVGAELARTRGASVLLIGSETDKAVVDAVRAAWPADVPVALLAADIDLVLLAAVLERLTLFITGDTGPMHIAAAVDTPVLAIFGPSLPTRYAPLSSCSKMVRIDIHCSPCNLMRQPPARCLGRVPDCLAGIATADVLRAANEMLDAS